VSAAEPIPRSVHDERAALRAGLLFGIAAYGFWGVVPWYFRQLSHVPAPVVLGHRIIWSVLVLALLVTGYRQWPQMRQIAGSRRAWVWLGASTVCIGSNWLVFIHAVASNQLLQSSLGYFMTPLINVLLGMVFLHERLRSAQWVAVVLAAAGVTYLTVVQGGLPWIALALAVSFGFYGLLRKRAPAGPMTGLFFETLLLLPLAAAYLIWAHTGPGSESFEGPGTLTLLIFLGLITSVPLIWFAAAARRLPLVTLGFLQYISPTLQFLMAVWVFGEPFDEQRAAAFAVIWTALAVYVYDTVRHASRRPELAR
jgi:chloramphenicol-sensitive protein RarD